MDYVKNIVAKTLSNLCVLLKLMSTSLILLWALYSFLLTSSPTNLSKTLFRLSSLLLFPILLRMDSKVLLEHPPVSLLEPISYFHPLHSSFYFSNHTLSNFAPCCSLATWPMLFLGNLASAISFHADFCTSSKS